MTTRDARAYFATFASVSEQTKNTVASTSGDRRVSVESELNGSRAPIRQGSERRGEPALRQLARVQSGRKLMEITGSTLELGLRAHEPGANRFICIRADPWRESPRAVSRRTAPS